MARHSFISFGVIALALIGTTASAEKKAEPLAIKLSSSFAPAETDVQVRMRVEPDSRARQLVLEWVSDDLSGGSHVVNLEGDRAAASHSYAIKRMSEGQYRVTAILRLNDGTEIRRAAEVTVVGMGSFGRTNSGGAQGSAGGKLPAGRK